MRSFMFSNKKISWWVFLLFAAALCAQNKPKPPRFAVEISDSGGAFLDLRNVAEDPEAKQLLMWRGPALAGLLASNAADPSVLEIDGFAISYQIDGDSVAVKPEGYRAIAPPRLGPPTTRMPDLRELNAPVTAGAIAVLSLNETAAFPEMARLHLQPLTVRIVPAKRSAPSLFTAQSKAKSIHLALLWQVDYVGEPWHSFRLQVRNNSTQAAMGVMICELCQHGKGCASGDQRNIIQPGATEEIVTSNSCGTVADTLPIVVVEGAVFEDGASEGDPEAIAPTATAVIAARIQTRRILELVAHILADSNADDAAKLARIRAGVQELPEQPDKEVLDAIRRPLRGMAPGIQRTAQFHASLGLMETKQRVLVAVSRFDRSNGKPLADWWSEWSRSM